MKQWIATVCLVALTLPAATARAGDIDDKAVERADNFLKTTKRGEFITLFCHFGQKYLRHSRVKTMTVRDATGGTVAGHFALVYDIKASDSLDTQLAFLCDTKGNVYKCQVMASNGVVQKPFAMANVSIKLLGEGLYESLKDSLAEGDRKLFRRLVDDADANGLMILIMRVQQSTE